ncbi:hypothetical protein CEXT_788231 [Caerostris extrusa]|uniref:Uncharacterized protein n=1 Tax=Caerostris extrusa TaxID=172846 RepID=A0AAV4STG5_CAEEX|nr:hypothetical protein CEXT_788231 [Caerostris extrusa]
MVQDFDVKEMFLQRFLLSAEKFRHLSTTCQLNEKEDPTRSERTFLDVRCNWVTPEDLVQKLDTYTNLRKQDIQADVRKLISNKNITTQLSKKRIFKCAERKTKTTSRIINSSCCHLQWL